MPKRELYNKKIHLTFIPLRFTKAGDFSRRAINNKEMSGEIESDIVEICLGIR